MIARSGSIVAAELDEATGVDVASNFAGGERFELVRRTVVGGRAAAPALEPGRCSADVVRDAASAPAGPARACHLQQSSHAEGSRGRQRDSGERRPGGPVDGPSPCLFPRARWRAWRGVLGVPANVVPLGVDHSRFTPSTESGVVRCYAWATCTPTSDTSWSLARTGPASFAAPAPAADREQPRRSSVRRPRQDPGDRAFRAGRDQRPGGTLRRRASSPHIGALASSSFLRIARAFACPRSRRSRAGCRVVLRDSCTLRETGGEGGLFVAGDDPRDWAEAIQSLIDDSVLRMPRRVPAAWSTRRVTAGLGPLKRFGRRFPPELCEPWDGREGASGGAVRQPPALYGLPAQGFQGRGRAGPSASRAGRPSGGGHHAGRTQQASVLPRRHRCRSSGGRQIAIAVAD